MKGLVLLVCTLSLTLNSASRKAWGALPPVKRIVLASMHGNGDYLNHVAEPPEEPTLSERLFNKSISSELAERYNALYDDYESRNHYAQGGLENELRYRDGNKSLADWTMHRMLDDNIRTPMRKWAWRKLKRTWRELRDGSPEDRARAEHEAKVAAAKRAASGAGQGDARSGAASETTSKAAKPHSSFSLLDIYGHLETFYNNGLWLDADTLMRFQYDVPAGVMDLEFDGGFINTRLDYFVTPLNFNTSSGFGGNSANPERAAVSLAKGFDGLGLSTDMHYGLMSRTLNYGMSKSLVGPLSAAVSQNHGLSDSSHDETTYRLSLGLSF